MPDKEDKAKSQQQLFLPLTREVARAQRVTEGETNQMSARVVAGFHACPRRRQNTDVRNVGRGLALSEFRVQMSDVRTVGRGLAPAVKMAVG